MILIGPGIGAGRETAIRDHIEHAFEREQLTAHEDEMLQRVRETVVSRGLGHCRTCREWDEDVPNENVPFTIGPGMSPTTTDKADRVEL